MDHTLWLPYTQMQTAPTPIEAVRTAGTKIHLADGRILTDGIASWWTACHGYNHPYLIAALQKQATQMPHIMLGGIVHEPARQLSHRLAALTPGDLNHVFFVDSGSASVEVGLKIAMQYWRNLGQPKKNRFIHFRNAYHGDTFGAMSVCCPVDSMHHLFSHMLPQQFCHALPTNEADWLALEDTFITHHGEIAGLIIEPLVQGACGMHCHSPTVLKRLRALCDKHHILFIADEVFTGFGRTGTFFAVHQADITPDIMCLGKALTGGLMPLSATIARTPIYEAFCDDDDTKCLMHGPTYMGNPLACAVANASLDLFEQDPTLSLVKSLSTQIAAAFAPWRNNPAVARVDCLGAIGALTLKKEVPFYAPTSRARFIDAGVWIRPIERTIYLCPAFNMDAADFNRLTQAIDNEISCLSG